MFVLTIKNNKIHIENIQIIVIVLLLQRNTTSIPDKWHN